MLVSPNCESRVYPPYLHLHLRHMRMAAHLPYGIFYCLLLRKKITLGHFLCLCSIIIWKALLAHHNISLLQKETKYKSVR